MTLHVAERAPLAFRRTMLVEAEGVAPRCEVTSADFESSAGG